MDGSVALCLFRVVQEALRNAGAHSGAEEVRVSLGTRNGQLHLSIGDAGRGFDVEQLKTKGLGLIGMEERVRQVGGTFTITSRSGEGTRIDIEIPPAPAA
jgi:signal transduction histidine kinase